MAVSAISTTAHPVFSGTDGEWAHRPFLFEKDSFICENNIYVTRETIDALPTFLKNDLFKKVHELSGTSSAYSLSWGENHFMDNERLLRQAFYELIIEPFPEIFIGRPSEEYRRLFDSVKEGATLIRDDPDYGMHHLFDSFEKLARLTSLYMVIEEETGKGMLLNPHQMHNSEYFRVLCSTEMRAGDQRIVLPLGISMENFQIYIELKKIKGEDLDLEMGAPRDIIPLFITAQYFQDKSIILKLRVMMIMQRHNDIATSYTVTEEDLLALSVNSGSFEKDSLSVLTEFVVNAYLKQYPEDIESLEALCPECREVPFELHLPGKHSFWSTEPAYIFTNESLERLSIVFPNIDALYLPYNARVTSIPPQWNASLRVLDSISPTLQDLSALNDAPRLMHIGMTGALVEVVPTGCTALRRLDALRTTKLRDISGLNGLPDLEEIHITNGVSNFIEAAPRGCTALKKFTCEGSRLRDISGLNGLRYLKEINVSGTLVEAAPTGCIALQKFTADYSRYRDSSFRDISGLNDLLYLEEINITDTYVEAAPTGCIALRKFIAYGAGSLRDISGLNDLPYLEEIDISRTFIESAPIGCTALRRFAAYGAYYLHNISGLNGLQHLKAIDITYTLVEAAPIGCTALQVFIANSGYDARSIHSTVTLNDSANELPMNRFLTVRKLRDISGLNGLQHLERIDIDRTWVEAAPTGCTALRRFSAYGAENLRDIRGLKHLRHLEEIEIGRTPAGTSSCCVVS
ncbi:MAG: hypothetical protein K9M07_03185 [Simkaniaceae bacterium]|nr:hypothetical protein [Simkaniaceae bacterium]